MLRHCCSLLRPAYWHSYCLLVLPAGYWDCLLRERAPQAARTHTRPNVYPGSSSVIGSGSGGSFSPFSLGDICRASSCCLLPLPTAYCQLLARERCLVQNTTTCNCAIAHPAGVSLRRSGGGGPSGRRLYPHWHRPSFFCLLSTVFAYCILPLAYCALPLTRERAPLQVHEGQLLNLAVHSAHCPLPLLTAYCLPGTAY